MTDRQFTTIAATASRGRILIPVPFDPDTVWGTKPRHLIHGTVNGMGVRGVIEPVGDGHGFALGPAWLRCGLAAGDTVTVHIQPEDPNAETSPTTSPPPSTPTHKPRPSSTPSPSSTDALTSAGSTLPNDDRSNAHNALPK